MKKYKLLVLTDHLTHSKHNSVYKLLKIMSMNKHCEYIHVASRGSKFNEPFFTKCSSPSIYVKKVDDTFSYKNRSKFFEKKGNLTPLEKYDYIFSRLPHPISRKFAKYLTSIFPKEKIINNPEDVLETGSKKYLLEFKHLCPPIKLCHSKKDVISFAKKFSVVLKPTHGHGGKGITKINQLFNEENKRLKELLQNIKFPLLAMKFLKNVNQGDKRINVVNGVIVGSTIRIPKKGSWICNASRGGKPQKCSVTRKEREIVNEVSKNILPRGIIIFGVDTLMGDNGKRTLSEINTASVGGLIQAEELHQKPVIQRTSNLLWKYITS